MKSPQIPSVLNHLKQTNLGVAIAIATYLDPGGIHPLTRGVRAEAFKTISFFAGNLPHTRN